MSLTRDTDTGGGSEASSIPRHTGETGAMLGAVEWFRPGEHDRVEDVLAGLARSGLTSLRTGVSWADCHTPEGAEWCDWLIPRLARDVELLPCFTYTPPSLGVVAKSSAPPRVPKAYADFLDVITTRHGRHFEWVELWNERAEEHTSELQSLMRISYAVFCLKNRKEPGKQIRETERD